MTDDALHYKCRCGHYDYDHEQVDEFKFPCWKCYCHSFDLDNLIYLEIKDKEREE